MTALSSTLVIERRTGILWSNLALGLVLVVGVVVSGYNMFGYPLYLGDEGIYMARAYAVAELGWLTPYTYWYDHAPAGWLLLAAWSVLTGGFDTFDTAINGGRVFMLLLHLVSLALLFRLALRLSENIVVALLTGFVYALSPLAIVYGRMVLLDNMMVFWLLLAATLLTQHGSRLWPVIASGAFFGLAVLTKENAFFLLPAFIYGVWRLAEQNHARFARAGWLFAALATLSLYPLYAALRTELVTLTLFHPLSGEGEGSISLVGSLVWQLTRSGGAPWHPDSDFFRLLTTNWLLKDPWLLGLGAAATLYNLFSGPAPRRFVALLSLAALLSIAHGNQAIEFYIVPVLPFLALNLGLALADLAGRLNAQSMAPLAVVAALALGWFNLSGQRDMFTLDITSIQRQALAWVQQHVPANSQIVTDDDLWVDLRGGGRGRYTYPGAHSHWQVANDPAVYHDLFHENWQLIDYMILSPNLDEIFARNPDRLTYQAYSHSTPLADFQVGEARVEIRKVNNPGIAVHEMLTWSYQSFKERYIRNGQVRRDEGYTDAHDQATAMLMAVWMDDRDTFDELWAWTYAHLQSDTGLLYRTNKPGTKPESSTAADTDAALALLLAEKRWHDAGYGRHGQRMVQAIWEHEVVEIKGQPYLAAGDWAINKNQVIYTPAAFTPYAYHVFAAADPEHNWWYLLDINYKFLTELTTVTTEETVSTGLLPGYLALNRWTGKVESALPEHLPADSAAFDARAAQVYWRVGVDAQWHDDQRADDFLTASPFLLDEWQTDGRLPASYTLAGTPRSSDESLLLYSAVLPKFMIEQPQAAHELFATKLASAFNQEQDDIWWGNSPDLPQEQWAWLAAGLYANSLNYQWNTGVTRLIP